MPFSTTMRKSPCKTKTSVANVSCLCHCCSLTLRVGVGACARVRVGVLRVGVLPSFMGGGHSPLLQNLNIFGQRESQSRQQEYTKLCTRDGGPFVRRPDDEGTGSVRAGPRQQQRSGYDSCGRSLFSLPYNHIESYPHSGPLKSPIKRREKGRAFLGSVRT